MENVKMNVKNNQASSKANQQTNQQTSQELQKTVVNGKVVSLKQAQQIEEQFNQQGQQTGIQAHHNNDSESVPAGQVAQNQNMVQSHSEQQAVINQTNLQSGQSHLEGMQGAGMTHEQEMQQKDHDAIQGSIDAKASTKAKAKKEE
jgi:hypothetical protein